MKRSALDKAITQLEEQQRIVELAIAVLKAQQTAKPTRKPRAGLTAAIRKLPTEE